MTPAIASINQADLTAHQLKFKQQLERIVTKIAIDSDFTITFEDLEPLAVPSRLKEYLTQIAPIDLNRYLTAKLQKYLYNFFTTGVSQKPQNSWFQEAIKGENVRNLPKTGYVNHANKWSKTKFYQELTQNNHSQGYEDPDWLVVKQENDYWHVTKNDLTLHIQSNHLAELSADLAPGKLISLRMPPSLVERGVYIAVGEVGSANNNHKVSLTEDSTINQLYFNVGTGGALCLLSSLTQKLNQVRVPFDFRINYDEAEFDGFEAVILEFRSSDYDPIYAAVQTTYPGLQTYFRPDIPFFCKFLAPGLGFAEKPQASTEPMENMGQHCCGIIALALVELWQSENNQFENNLNNKLTYVLNYLAKNNIDLEHLYLNPGRNHKS